MENMPIQGADAAILVILLISAIFGFIRGFVKETLSVAGWVGAIFLSLYLFPIAQPIAREFILNLLIADILTGAVIFILSLVILSYISHAISEKVKASSLGALDRSLGIFFGIARGAILLGIAWLVFVQFIPEKDRPEWILQARMLPIIEASGEFVARLLPPDMQENLNISKESDKDTMDRLKQKYDELPDGVKDGLKNSVDGAVNLLDKGYDDKARQQMENLTKSTQEKPK
ncbi:CvpA family protein [Sneathiella sp. CAU 1612]|jgi:membrane protein required for colicin V production|uniref:CvpA family protein n=1 Tax=Sneathiella sedimenti TaxID=2816034 RepID=A0ABS3F7M4_9PROT|nr:CvpA family protein [Sneathiella sedimenti]MBO0334501.1 CvpA family protein [Sneathiella sedimenti]